MDLLDHLIGLRVSALKLPPPMDVEWLLELIGQELAFLLLLKKFLLKDVDLLLEIGDASGLTLGDQELPLEFSDLLPDILDISESIFVVNLAFLKH